MRKNCGFLLFSIIIMWIMCSTLCFATHISPKSGLSEKEAQTFANENNTWVICYQQGSRTSNFYQYDATDSYLYFSYSKHNCVDVYDMEGVFLYSIVFPERKNGGISVRCENSQVYICTKDNILYVFSGTEEVVHMNYDTAAEKGYNFFWFYDNEPHISVDGKWIRWIDETGDVIKNIPTPQIIMKTTPPSRAAMIVMPIIAVSTVLLLFIIKVLTQAIFKFFR